MEEKKIARYGALWGAILGVFMTAIYDLIKSKPFLSTLWRVINWIWDSIFMYQVTIWQILIVVILFLIFKRIVFEIKLSETKDSPVFLDYKEDIINDTTWRWEWKWSVFEKSYIIVNLEPLCKECETPLKLYDFSINPYGECPRCDKTIKITKTKEKMERIIIDNIKKGVKNK
ncbi:hypothetical protein NH341_08130 [Tenacibaculum sp. XPcli2-G]|uniref:hypothetical protein n=1 Tax=Tenacibaculum sp. XPcli2-G TaxID=2954503 RepID=UPI0020983501|nr:hypothetical protein [Tenacibaculum sp. XPcli2-G]MCO7185390.1 hypothetical protein [Tenacibaculum sp. XPcli2-G]